MTSDKQEREHRLETCNRLLLAHRIFDLVYEHTEVFYDHNVGSDLAYLMGAIVDVKNPLDSFVDWSDNNMETPPLLFEILKQNLPADHIVWEFVMIEEDKLAPSGE